MRYRLQDVIQRLMFDPAAAPDRQAAICKCHWRRIGDRVTVRRHKETGRVHYGGVVSCNNVWICPVCSGRITDGRRDELQRAVQHWKEQGGECYLVTATFPHQRADDLARLLELMRDTARYFNQDRAVRRAREAAGYIGSIRALEVTWGSWHGWHPHFHFLYFCQPGQLDTLRQLETAWVNALIHTGLADRAKLNDMLHGADGEAAAWDVQNGDFAADYIAKFGHEPSLRSKIEAGAPWSVTAEMVKGMAKTGRRLRGVTPFTLAAVVAGICELRGMTKGRAVGLFCEYAAAFKGQRQLYWSPGLADSLTMGELFSDEELAALEEAKPHYEDVGEISREDWALVLAHGQRDEVARATEEAGAAGLKAAAAGLARALEELRRRGPPPKSPRVTRENEDGTVHWGIDAVT